MFGLFGSSRRSSRHCCGFCASSSKYLHGDLKRLGVWPDESRCVVFGLCTSSRCCGFALPVLAWDLKRLGVWPDEFHDMSHGLTLYYEAHGQSL